MSHRRLFELYDARTATCVGVYETRSDAQQEIERIQQEEGATEAIHYGIVVVDATEEEAAQALQRPQNRRLTPVNVE